ncbi:hypothetical protein NMG60_11020652 [Bertholletia excelsa]
MNHDSTTPNSNNAVDVERGLVELRKLGIELQIWEESRNLGNQDSNSRLPIHSNF